jgi:hypothetical protein
MMLILHWLDGWLQRDQPFKKLKFNFAKSVQAGSNQACKQRLRHIPVRNLFYSLRSKGSFSVNVQRFAFASTLCYWQLQTD